MKVIEIRAGFNWWEAWGEIKIEGFGGRPPFGGRPGALGPMPLPLNPALIEIQIGIADWNRIHLGEVCALQNNALVTVCLLYTSDAADE